MGRKSTEFWSLVDIRGPDDCWLWLGITDKDGYGRYGHSMKAHRKAYELTYGKLPPGTQVRHKVCDNPPCQNPRHLRSGTHLDNMQDMVEHGRSAKGERNPEAVLNESQVILIRKYDKLGLSAPAIAKSTGIHRRTILNVLHGDTWSHV